MSEQRLLKRRNVMGARYEPIPIVDTARRCGVVIDSQTLGRREVEAVCPFCGDKPRRHHLSMNTAKDLYKCMLCGASGNSVSMYARLQNVSNTEAARELLNCSNIYPFPSHPSSNAVNNDGEGVLGKILYYSLSSVLIEKGTLAKICEDLGFPYNSSKRLAMSDAFRSATGDISDSKTVQGVFGAEVFKVYCRDNQTKEGTLSRELIKETLDAHTNTYKKLANITFSKGTGMSYDDLVYDEHVDPLDYCREAAELFELYQVCAGRKQIETLLENFVGSLRAVKLLSHGKMYFVPREHMNKLDVFEDLITQIEANNRYHKRNRLPMDSNSMYVVDDAKQREKMAMAFYRSVRREIAEYHERASYLIQSGSESPAIMDRWVVKIDNLEQKKREYEAVLKRELNDIDDDFSSLNYLAQELQIRARGIRRSKVA